MDRASYRRNFGRDVLEEFFSVWQACAELGLLSIHSDAIRLTPEGAYRVPLIQTALMQGRVEEITEAHFAQLRAAVGRSAPGHGTAP